MITKLETKKREKRQETENGGLFIAYRNVIPCDAKDSILLTTYYYYQLRQVKSPPFLFSIVPIVDCIRLWLRA